MTTRIRVSAGAGEAAGAHSTSGARLRQRVAALFNQRDRLALWIPVAMGAGACAYFLAPTAPPVGMWLAAGAVAGALAVWGARHPQRQVRRWRDFSLLWAVRLMTLFCCAAAAIGASHVRTVSLAAPRLANEIGPAMLTGWVAEVEAGARRPRMRILVAEIEGLSAPPRFVRVSAPSVLTPGRAVSCRVRLTPPEPPLTPTGFDAQRRAYFEQVGGQGFALGHCRPLPELGAPSSRWDQATLMVAAWRRDLAEGVIAAAPGAGGEIAAALIAGDESLMRPEDRAALRDSGLGHLLSVSGLHMSLVAGMAFWLLRRGLALIPPLALRANVRKLAAAGALAATGAYLVISGMSVPAIRAFVMTAVALGAVLIDRPAITMRGLAFAACVILLTTPEAVLEPGFQRSFAATAALVAVFEANVTKRGPQAALPTPGPIVGGLQAIWGGLAGALAASLVAGLATDAFALHHFQRLTFYGLPANLAASPIVTFLVAPAAAAAAALAPFGLAELPLALMAWSLELILGIGEAFAARPEAVRPMPASTGAVLAAVALATVWATLWQGPLRWGAVGLAAVAAGLYATAPRPIALASPGLEVVVTRVEGGGWRRLAPDQGETFLKSRLTAAAGLPETADIPAPDGCLPGEVCAWRTPGGRMISVEPAAGVLSLEGGLRVLRAGPDEGGLLIHETASGLTLRRARPLGYDRAWAPSMEGP